MKMWQKSMYAGAMYIGMFALMLCMILILEGYYYDSLIAFLLSIGFIVFSYCSYNKFKEYDENN